MRPNAQETADFVILTEKSLTENFIFVQCNNCYFEGYEKSETDKIYVDKVVYVRKSAES